MPPVSRSERSNHGSNGQERTTASKVGLMEIRYGASVGKYAEPSAEYAIAIVSARYLILQVCWRMAASRVGVNANCACLPTDAGARTGRYSRFREAYNQG